MKVKRILFLLLMAGILASCSKEEDVKHATGTVIGSYSNGFFSLLVQIDEEYQIGKTIEHSRRWPCVTMPEAPGTYLNMIQTQVYLPAPEIMNKRIAFSYRVFRDGKDNALFFHGPANAFCMPPDFPIFVITHCQILN